MPAIIVPALWIIFDVAICLRTGYMTHPFSGLEWWCWLGSGLSLSGLAIFAQWHERRGHETDMNALREQLIKAQAFHEGAYSLLGRRLDTIESQAKASGNSAISGEVTQLKADLNPVKGMLAELTQLTASPAPDSNQLSARLVRAFITIRNLGPATAIAGWTCGYRNAAGARTYLTSGVFDKTIETATNGERGNNLFLDEDLIPERGKRSGFLAFWASSEDTRAIFDVDGQLTITFTDVEGHAYSIEHPPAKIREALRARREKDKDN